MKMVAGSCGSEANMAGSLLFEPVLKVSPTTFVGDGSCASTFRPVLDQHAEVST